MRVLALVEAATVTGPVKNLLEFAQRAARPAGGTSVANLSLVTFLREPAQSNEFIRAAEGAGIPISILHERRRFDAEPKNRLRRIVAAVRPDIIQSHNYKSHLFVRSMGFDREFPWIAFNHGYTATDLKDRIYNQFDRWSLRAAHRVVCVCRPFADKVERMGVSPERIRIQHNSVPSFVAPDESAVRALREGLGLGSSPVVIVVGRLSHEKGHADLLKAIARMSQTGTLAGTRFVFAGDGPERAALGTSRHVVFAGHRKDIRPFYAMATLLVLPSLSEGSPNVVLEAMAAGVPVIATAVGGVPEIVTHEQTGLLVPARDVDAMADAIARLLDDSALRSRLAQAALERVRTHHTPEAYCSSLLAVYAEACLSYRAGAGHRG